MAAIRHTNAGVDVVKGKLLYLSYAPAMSSIHPYTSIVITPIHTVSLQLILEPLAFCSPFLKNINREEKFDMYT